MTPPATEQPVRSAPVGGPHAVDRDAHPRRCKAHTRSGEQCRAYAVEDMTVCRMHGGSSPQARRAAERRKADAEAVRLLQVVWDPNAAPVTDPVEALQKLAGQLQHAVNVLGARLHDDDDLDHATGLLWTRVLSQLRQALEGMEKLDLAEKALQLERDKATMVGYAFNAAIEELRLAPEDRARVVDVFVGRLRSPAPVVRGQVMSGGD